MQHLLLLSALVAVAWCHFVLQVPTSLGFDDTKEGTAPCGGFDITNRNTVTNWPILGAPIQIISTHPQADWEIRAALLSDTGNFVYMVPPLSQQGLGTFCLPAVPGIANWEGKDAVLQMIQHAVDGALYQCAAVKFVSGSAVSVPDSCKNSTGVVASYTTLTGSEISTSTMQGSSTMAPSNPTTTAITGTTGLTGSVSSATGSSAIAPAATSKAAAGDLRAEMGMGFWTLALLCRWLL